MYQTKSENCCVPKVREFTSMFALYEFYFSKSEACRPVSEKAKNGCSPNVRKLSRVWAFYKFYFLGYGTGSLGFGKVKIIACSNPR